MKSVICGLAVLVLAAAVGRADEEKVALDKLPKAVVETVKKRFPKAEMVAASKEEGEDKKIVFEVEIKDDGAMIDVTLTAEGVLVGFEKTIAAKDLPKAAAEAVETKYPKATHTKYEEVVKVKEGKEVTEYYEVFLTTADKKMLEVEVTAEGKIVKTTEKKEEKKEEKKDK